MRAVVQRYSKPQEGAGTLQKKIDLEPAARMVDLSRFATRSFLTCMKQRVKRLPTVHREAVIKSYEENRLGEQLII